MPWDPFSTNHHSSMGLTCARPNTIWMRWTFCPWLPTPYRTYTCHFQVVLQKEGQNLSIAARHSGLRAHPTPGRWALQSTSQSWERFRTSCCLKAPQTLWISMGKWPHKLFWIKFASINEPGSWSGQTGDYLVRIWINVMQAESGLTTAEDISP